MHMGNLLSRLTEYDRKVMSRYIDLYAAEDSLSRIKHKASIDTVFETWAKKKETLSKMFPDNALTIEEDICYKKDVNQIYTDIENSEIVNIFRFTMKRAWMAYLHDNPSAGDVDIWYDNLYDLLSKRSLATNKYNYTSFVIRTQNGSIHVNNGMKTIRAIVKIAEAMGVDSQTIEEFRLEHSRLLNDTEIRGKLVFSIHPMDFMTMSDNDCNWSSCMSWTNKGEYRQGTIEMMNSPYVVEAYITSDEPYCFDDTDPYLTWNNKKWRELFIVHSNCIMGIKGYPFWNSDLEKIALAKLKTLATTKLGYQYEDNVQKFSYEEDYNDAGDLTDENGQHHFFECGYMYNDFRYEHWGYLAKDYFVETTIDYSGPSQCMLCGRLWEVDQAEDIICDECYAEKCTCPICGITTSNIVYNRYTKSEMCWDCFDANYVYDVIAGQTIPIEDATLMEIQFTNGVISHHSYTSTAWLSEHWIEGIRKHDDGQRVIITPEILHLLQEKHIQELH